MVVNLEMLRLLASVKFTLVLLVWASGVLAYSLWAVEPVGLTVSPPLALLCLNLLAAILVNRALRTNIGLLIFHLGLASIAVIGAGGRFFSFDGYIEVPVGGAFHREDVVSIFSGPFYQSKLPENLFVQQDFTIEYQTGMQRRQTHSSLYLGDGETITIGDDKPLRYGDYRIYSSSNKGFAAIIGYENTSGMTANGAAHFPGYPVNYDNQVNQWTVPGTDREYGLWLHFKDIFNETAPWSFQVPSDPKLELKNETGINVTLEPGQSAMLPEGKVTFFEVKKWMGYSIKYDPSTKWVLAASVVALLGLAWHIMRKFTKSSWDQDDRTSEC